MNCRIREDIVPLVKDGFINGVYPDYVVRVNNET
jgi:hypothetical protein